jgi:hypothetical protein
VRDQQLTLRLRIPASPEVAACQQVLDGFQCTHEDGHASAGRPWCVHQAEGIGRFWRVTKAGRLVVFRTPGIDADEGDEAAQVGLW